MKIISKLIFIIYLLPLTIHAQRGARIAYIDMDVILSKNKEFKLFSKGKESLEKLTFLDRDSLVRECKNFNPSVIYYRPVADNLEFHNLACEIISCLRVPLVTHVMDDWIDRPSQKNSKLYLELKKSFCNQLAIKLEIFKLPSYTFMQILCIRWMI